MKIYEKTQTQTRKHKLFFVWSFCVFAFFAFLLFIGFFAFLAFFAFYLHFQFKRFFSPKSLALLDLKSTKLCEKKSMKIYKENLWKPIRPDILTKQKQVLILQKQKHKHKTENTNFFFIILLFCYFCFSCFFSNLVTCFLHIQFERFFSPFFCFDVFF